MSFKIKIILSLFGLAASALVFSGCATTSSEAVSGEKLWAQNCNRCHNIRGPSTYSPAQWEVSMLHRRIHANLTAEEHAKILEFLQSSN